MGYKHKGQSQLSRNRISLTTPASWDHFAMTIFMRQTVLSDHNNFYQQRERSFRLQRDEVSSAFGGRIVVLVDSWRCARVNISAYVQFVDQLNRKEECRLRFAPQTF